MALKRRESAFEIKTNMYELYERTDGQKVKKSLKRMMAIFHTITAFNLMKNSNLVFYKTIIPFYHLTNLETVFPILECQFLYNRLFCTKKFSPVGWSSKIQRNKTSLPHPKRCSRYHTILPDGETLILQLWGM